MRYYNASSWDRNHETRGLAWHVWFCLDGCVCWWCDTFVMLPKHTTPRILAVYSSGAGWSRHSKSFENQVYARRCARQASPQCVQFILTKYYVWACIWRYRRLEMILLVYKLLHTQQWLSRTTVIKLTKNDFILLMWEF